MRAAAKLNLFTTKARKTRKDKNENDI